MQLFRLQNKLSRRRIVEQARTWIGTPYHHQGRLKGIGVDCIGLILGVAKELGIEGLDREEFTHYGRLPPRGRGMLGYFDTMSVRVDCPKIGDAIVMWMNRVSRRPQHVAMLTDHGILHCHSTSGFVVEHTYSADWQEKYLAAYAFPTEIED